MAKTVIKTWDEADSALERLSDARRRQALIAREAEGAIDAAKARAKEQAKASVDQERLLVAGLKTFALLHEGEMEGRSRKLTHGTVGFRTSAALVLLRSAEFVLGALRAKRLEHCIRVREEIDKEQLRRYDDDTMRAVGCALRATDNFYAETEEVVL